MPRDTRPATQKPERSVTMTELVLPSHTNAHGTIFGGVVMSWIDIAGAIAAGRYARSAVVTVSIDSMHFLVPIKIGHIVELEASVTHVGSTSMEVEAIVRAENPVSGQTRMTTQAYLTYVAVDEYGRPKVVPSWRPKTRQEKEKWAAAEARRAQRLKLA